MTDLQIKNKINETLYKISIHSLNEKIRMFQHVDLPFISIRYKNVSEKPTRKKLRFYLDLINTWYPLDSKSGNEHKANLISQIFKCECSEEDLSKLASFKEITKKKVIVFENDKVKTISRLRWRGRDNLTKNIIHHRD